MSLWTCEGNTVSVLKFISFSRKCFFLKPIPFWGKFCLNDIIKYISLWLSICDIYIHGCSIIRKGTHRSFCGCINGAVEENTVGKIMKLGKLAVVIVFRYVKSNKCAHASPLKTWILVDHHVNYHCIKFYACTPQYEGARGFCCDWCHLVLTDISKGGQIGAMFSIVPWNTGSIFWWINIFPSPSTLCQ